MLFHLLYEQLFEYFSPFRVFSYITTRTAFASLTALGLGLLLGPWLIRRLREFQVGLPVELERALRVVEERLVAAAENTTGSTTGNRETNQ